MSLMGWVRRAGNLSNGKQQGAIRRRLHPVVGRVDSVGLHFKWTARAHARPCPRLYPARLNRHHAPTDCMTTKVPLTELNDRVNRFRARMDAESPRWELAAFFGRVNQFYFTGTVQDGLLLIPRGGEPVFWVRRSFERARAESLFPDIRPDEELSRRGLGSQRRHSYRGRGGAGGVASAVSQAFSLRRDSGARCADGEGPGDKEPVRIGHPDPSGHRPPRNPRRRRSCALARGDERGRVRLRALLADGPRRASRNRPLCHVWRRGGRGADWVRG